MSSSRQSKEKRLSIHQRNLRLLLEQLAHFGRANAPTHLLAQIEDELEEIRSLCKELDLPLPSEVQEGDLTSGASTSAGRRGVADSASNKFVESAPRFAAFMSYSSADREKVQRLTDRLERAGLSIWLDLKQIAPGDSITLKIEDGLKRSDYLVVCLTKNSLRSGWSHAEFAPMLHKEIRERGTRVIPVLIDEIEREDVPPLLYDKLYVDVRTEEGLNRLIAKVRNPPL